MNLPVMIFHQGKPGYLKQVTQQASKWNSQVWLLGDETNKNCAAKWVDSTALESSMFQEFLKVYEHMSTRPYKAEMFCFESHFKYYSFAKKMGWNKFITMDSDVMVYHRFEESEFEDADAAFGWTENGETEIEWACDPFVTYWTIEAMEEFLRFCIEIYKGNKAVLLQKWNYHKKNKVPGGICDMTLFWLWRNRTDKKICNLVQEKDGKTYDILVNSPDNFQKNEYEFSNFRNMKRIYFRKGIPYLKKMDGRWVQAKVLHCNGHHKQCIRFLKRCSNVGLEYALMNWMITMKIGLKRFKRKIVKNY